MTDMSDSKDTRELVLETAERLAQQRGFHAFSYKDIGNLVGIKTASIHYYFPHKSDMAEAMVERYIAHARAGVEQAEQAFKSARKRLRAFGDFFLSIPVKDDRYCLLGMLGAEVLTMSEPVQQQLAGAFSFFEEWLERNIALGVEQGEITLRESESPREAANVLLATLEGGMMIARTRAEPDYYDRLIKTALGRLGVPADP